MKKIALTLATAAGVVALSAGPASAAGPVGASSSAIGQAMDNSSNRMQRVVDQMNQGLSAGENAAALDAAASEMSMAQAAAKAMKDATSGYAG
jgi:hypothetical protein